MLIAQPRNLLLVLSEDPTSRFEFAIVTQSLSAIGLTRLFDSSDGIESTAVPMEEHFVLRSFAWEIIQGGEITAVVARLPPRDRRRRKPWAKCPSGSMIVEKSGQVGNVLGWRPEIECMCSSGSWALHKKSVQVHTDRGHCTRNQCTCPIGIIDVSRENWAAKFSCSQMR